SANPRRTPIKFRCCSKASPPSWTGPTPSCRCRRCICSARSCSRWSNGSSTSRTLPARIHPNRPGDRARGPERCAHRQAPLAHREPVLMMVVFGVVFLLLNIPLFRLAVLGETDDDLAEIGPRHFIPWLAILAVFPGITYVGNLYFGDRNGIVDVSLQ